MSQLKKYGSERMLKGKKGANEVFKGMGKLKEQTKMLKITKTMNGKR